MAVKTFQQTDTAASFGAVQSCSAYATSAAPSAKAASVGGSAGSTPVVVTINRDAAAPRSGVMFQVDPGLAYWPPGSWSVELVVSVGDANLTIDSAYICRRTSGNVAVGTVGSNVAVATSLSSTGTKTITITGAASSGSSSDVAYIVLAFDNAATSSRMFTYVPSGTIQMPLDIVLTPDPVSFTSGAEDVSTAAIVTVDEVNFSFGFPAPTITPGEVIVAPSPVAIFGAAETLGTALTNISPDVLRSRITVPTPTVTAILPFTYAAIGTPGGSTGVTTDSQRTLFLCRLAKVTRRDGEVYRYTDHDRPVPFHEGYTQQEYSPLGAPDFGSRRMVSALEPETDGVRGFMGTVLQNALTSTDVMGGRWDRAQVEVWVVSWRNPWLAPLDYRRYWMHDVTFSGEEWSAQLRGLADQIDVLTGRVFTKRCDARVGDDRCGVNLLVPEFSVQNASVLSITGLNGGDNPRLKFKTNITGYQSGWFRYGVLRWVTGANVGVDEHDVRVHTDSGTGAVIQLWLETQSDVAVNDLFDITAGCDHSFHGACIGKFGNGVNFRGFPWLAGWRKILRQPNGQDFG